jgi:RsiW-degrading membrane proteinase PrsW (M82 family)
VITPTTLGYAFIGGLLPSLIWLYFILKEDRTHPEPRSLIALTFIAGMLAVPLAIPLEQYAKAHLANSFTVFTSWALIEEVLKYMMAAVFILWRKAVDEPPDYVIYMVTVALGFAAAENMLFLVDPTCSAGASVVTEWTRSAAFLCTDGVRFLGANLLHVVASASIGFALAFSTKFRPAGRVLAASLGLILAVALHTAFNLLIIDVSALTALFLVWVVTVILLATFEVLKYFQYRST